MKEITEEYFAFKEIEKELLDPIYVGFESLFFDESVIINTEQSVENFIKNDLLSLCKYNETFKKDSLGKNKRQCRKNALRSLGDLFIITRHYYPDITLENFCKIFWLQEDLCSHICSTINRRVYFKTNDGKPGYLEDCDLEDEFGFLIEDVVHEKVDKEKSYDDDTEDWYDGDDDDW